jgi:hypothetical protein
MDFTEIEKCLKDYSKKDQITIFAFISQATLLDGSNHSSLFSLQMEMILFMQKHHPTVLQKFNALLDELPNGKYIHKSKCICQSFFERSGYHSDACPLHV